MGRGRSAGSARSTIRRWCPVLLVGAAARVLYWTLVLPNWTPRSDADQYIRLSRSLAGGHGFSLNFPQLDLHPTAFRPPLYPTLLAPLNLVFGEALWPIRALNLVIGLLVVLLAAVFTARIGGRIAGLAAGTVVALYPPLIANDTVALTEPLALALLLGALLLVDDDRWVLAGVALGALLLTRPNGYLVVFVVAVWAGSRLGIRRGASVAGVAILVLAPWSIRNQIQLGTWHPTTSDGFTMAAMWAPPAQDAEHFVDPVLAPAYQDIDHRLLRFDEARWNEALTTEAIDAIRAHPGYLPTLIDRNARSYFEVDARLNRRPEKDDGRRWPFRRAVLPLFFLVTATGLAGVICALGDRRLQVLTVIVAQFVVLSLLLVAPPRLRAPFDLLMCIGVGLLVGRVVDATRGRRAREPVRSATGSSTAFELVE